MPLMIPKADEQKTYFASHLEPGEVVEDAFWIEQRLPWWMMMLIENAGFIAEILFAKVRNRYFAAITDRRVLLMGSTGMHKPINEKFEAWPRSSVACTKYWGYFGGGAMDWQIAGEPKKRLFRVPATQIRIAQICKTKLAAAPVAAPA